MQLTSNSLTLHKYSFRVRERQQVSRRRTTKLRGKRPINQYSLILEASTGRKVLLQWPEIILEWGHLVNLTEIIELVPSMTNQDRFLKFERSREDIHTLLALHHVCPAILFTE